MFPNTGNAVATINTVIQLLLHLYRDYAEHVRNLFQGLRLCIEGLQLSPTMSLADALDEAAQRGLLYVVILSTQNEMHRSVTLTILHGRNPQGNALCCLLRDTDCFILLHVGLTVVYERQQPGCQLWWAFTCWSKCKLNLPSYNSVTSSSLSAFFLSVYNVMLSPY